MSQPPQRLRRRPTRLVFILARPAYIDIVETLDKRTGDPKIVRLIEPRHFSIGTYMHFTDFSMPSSVVGRPFF